MQVRTASQVVSPRPAPPGAAVQRQSRSDTEPLERLFQTEPRLDRLACHDCQSRHGLPLACSLPALALQDSGVHRANAGARCMAAGMADDIGGMDPRCCGPTPGCSLSLWRGIVAHPLTLTSGSAIDNSTSKLLQIAGCLVNKRRRSRQLATGQSSLACAGHTQLS